MIVLVLFTVIQLRVRQYDPHLRTGAESLCAVAWPKLLFMILIMYLTLRMDFPISPQPRSCVRLYRTDIMI